MALPIVVDLDVLNRCIFRVSSAAMKAIIQTVLNDELQGKSYDKVQQK